MNHERNAFVREVHAGEITAAVNSLCIGLQGLGGKVTALLLIIEQYVTHIAGLPVSVNVG